MVDANAILEIRDIFKRNKEENFEANQFEIVGLKQILEKLIKYQK